MNQETIFYFTITFLMLALVVMMLEDLKK